MSSSIIQVKKGGDWVNPAISKKYAGAANPELFRAIDECTTLSQLFELIRREKVVVQMHAQSDASNITPTRIEEGVPDTTPLERFKQEIKNAVSPASKPQVTGYRSKEKARLLQAIDECTSLSQLFALIQLEKIVIQMHAQSGASNLAPRKLSYKEITEMKDTPFDRLKAEVRRSVLESDR